MNTKNDFSWVLTKQSAIVNFNGETVTVLADDPAYPKLVEAIKNEEWEVIPTYLSPRQAVADLSQDRLHVDGNQVYLKEDDGAEWPIPGALNDCILRHVNEGLPFDGLINFAYNLRQNPARRSIHQLFPWLESAKLTITEDGCFLGWKRIREDWTDCHTGTIRNGVGDSPEIDWSEVDDDPARHCSHGFHICSWDYLKSFRGERIVQVKVNPADVVSVPEDYNNTKMRVRKYTVMKEVEKNGDITQAPDMPALYQEEPEMASTETLE